MYKKTSSGCYWEALNPFLSELIRLSMSQAGFEPGSVNPAFVHEFECWLRPLGHNVRITKGIVCKYHVIKTAAGNLCNGLIRYWTGPLACLSLPSVMSRIRSDTSTWKLALSQSCSPRIERCRKRVKCLFRWTLMNEIDGQYYSRMDVPTLSMLLRPILPVATIWNTGETGDIYAI